MKVEDGLTDAGGWPRGRHGMGVSRRASLRLRSCAGDMYCGVPNTTPACVYSCYDQTGRARTSTITVTTLPLQPGVPGK